MKFFKQLMNIIIELFKKKRQLIFITPEQEQEKRAKRQNLKDNYKYIENLSEEHILLLEDIIKDEDNRLTIIENKLALITGQAAVIFTLVGLSAFVYDELNSINIWLKIIFFVILTYGLCAFIISIFLAGDSLKINDFPYARPDINTSLDDQIKDKDTFLKNKVKDLISSIERNTQTNNSKGDLLVKAHQAFVHGIVSSGILGLFIIILSFFNTNEDRPITIKRTDDILNLEKEVRDTRILINLMMVKGVISQDSTAAVKVNERLDSLDAAIQELKNELSNKQDTKKKVK